MDKVRSLVAQRDFVAADRLLNALLAAHPEHAAALHVKAVMLNMQGQSLEALPLMQRSLQQEPNDAGRWNDYGIVLAKLDRCDDAIAAYQRSITLAGETPAAANAYNNLGRLQRATNPGAAEQAFRRATALNPGFAQAWYNLSQVLKQLGRISEGVDAWARATVLAPQNAPTEHHARALVHLGRTKEAIALYRAWLKREPGNPLAKHHLEALLKPETAVRASDAYVETVFDGFAASFDETLALLGYRAPSLIRDALSAIHPHADARLSIADAGCGTGLCGPLVAPWANKLVGFDLSGGMIEQAQARGVYAQLHKAELVQYLAAHPAEFDVVVCADTLCYFAGLLEPLAAACIALRPGGYLVFTVEAVDTTDNTHRLLPSGRYAHSHAHIVATAASAGFAVYAVKNEKLREEAGQAVQGWLVTLARPFVVVNPECTTTHPVPVMAQGGASLRRPPP